MYLKSLEISASPGPDLFDGRSGHACAYIKKSKLVVVTGGAQGERTTEMLNLGNPSHDQYFIQVNDK